MIVRKVGALNIKVIVVEITAIIIIIVFLIRCNLECVIISPHCTRAWEGCTLRWTGAGLSKSTSTSATYPFAHHHNCHHPFVIHDWIVQELQHECTIFVCSSSSSRKHNPLDYLSSWAMTIMGQSSSPSSSSSQASLSLLWKKDTYWLDWGLHWESAVEHECALSFDFYCS